MDFREAENNFKELDRQVRAGKITPDQYYSGLAELRVTDSAGHVWQIQESTGQWFVFNGSQWLAALPPVPPRPKRFPWAIGIGSAVVVVGLVLAFLLLRPGGSPPDVPSAAVTGSPTQPASTPAAAATATQPSGPEFKALDSAAVKAGATFTDAAGTRLDLPDGSLPADSELLLTVLAPSGDLQADLGPAVALQTPLYALHASGSNDSSGYASLTLPAKDGSSRVMVVVDGRYYALLNVTPQNGVLEIQAPFGPSAPAGDPLNASLDLYYVVVGPTQTSRLNQPDGVSPARFAPAVTPTPDRYACDLSMLQAVRYPLCRAGIFGHVLAVYGTELASLTPQIEAMVDRIDEAMLRWQYMEFANAGLSSSSPLIVKVSAGGGVPLYQVFNGIVYIPADSVSAILTGGAYDVYHELAHWIQDRSYNMTYAFLSNELTWWQETSAEVMVMMQDAAYVEKNLRDYGMITGDTAQLTFQRSPFLWGEEFYVHAQQLYLGLCNNPVVCALNKEGFARAITDGDYPYSDAGAQAKLTGNLDDYARYLLGKIPLASNTAMPLRPLIISGDGYGDAVKVGATTKDPFRLAITNAAPQMTRDTSGAVGKVQLKASLEKGGIYPLYIVSQPGTAAALAASLKIQPGAAFWYTLDNGEPIFNDGAKELVIQPITSSGAGVATVRIAALGKAGGEVFQAELGMVDLSGAWMMAPVKEVSNTVTCHMDADGKDSTNSLAKQMSAMFSYIGLVFGDFKPDPAGSGLTWQLAPSRTGAMSASKTTFANKAAALISPTGIEIQQNIVLSREAAARPGAAALAGLVFLPAAVLGLRRQSRQRNGPRAVLAVCLALALLLAGCGEFKDHTTITFQGTVNMSASQAKMEYIGGQDTVTLYLFASGSSPAAVPSPMWKLSGGQVTYQLDMKVYSTSRDDNGKLTGETVSTCKGTSVYEVETSIFKDAVIVLPPSN